MRVFLAADGCRGNGRRGHTRVQEQAERQGQLIPRDSPLTVVTVTLSRVKTLPITQPITEASLIPLLQVPFPEPDEMYAY